MNYYRQCRLMKTTTFNKDGWHANQTSWIPEEFAHVGRIIKLKNKDGTWDDGWEVKEVGTRAPEDQVLERNQDYKHQRKASDI